MHPLGAQRLDVGRQSRNVDFSNAASTRPFKVGPSLPLNCLAGEQFFLSTAPAGQNVHSCTTTNTWAPLSGGAGSSAQQSEFLDFRAVRTSATVVTLNQGCTVSKPCNYRVQSALSVVTFSFTASASATITAGTGSGPVFIYLDSSSGALVFGHATGNTILCTGCTVVAGISSFPATATPLYELSVTGGQWDTFPGSADRRAFLDQVNSAALPPLPPVATTMNEVRMLVGCAGTTPSVNFQTIDGSSPVVSCHDNGGAAAELNTGYATMTKAGNDALVLPWILPSGVGLGSITLDLIWGADGEALTGTASIGVSTRCESGSVPLITDTPQWSTERVATTAPNAVRHGMARTTVALTAADFGACAAGDPVLFRMRLLDSSTYSGSAIAAVRARINYVKTL